MDNGDILGILAPGDTINIMAGTYCPASSDQTKVHGNINIVVTEGLSFIAGQKTLKNITINTDHDPGMPEYEDDCRRPSHDWLFRITVPPK